MTEPLSQDTKTSLWQRLAGTSFMFIAGWVALVWAIEIVDTAILGDRLQAQGIQPRTTRGLDGILWSPFLHAGFGHVLSNTAPFAILGGLVALRGRTHWLWITATSIVVGGALTWLFAGSGNHVGSSGVVFGYLGALLGAAAFERKMTYIAPAVIAVFFYGTILVGIVPQGGNISWEGHLAGLIAGGLATFVLAKTKPKPQPALATAEDPLLEVDDLIF